MTEEINTNSKEMRENTNEILVSLGEVEVNSKGQNTNLGENNVNGLNINLGENNTSSNEKKVRKPYYSGRKTSENARSRTTEKTRSKVVANTRGKATEETRTRTVRNNRGRTSENTRARAVENVIANVSESTRGRTIENTRSRATTTLGSKTIFSTRNRNTRNIENNDMEGIENRAAETIKSTRSTRSKVIRETAEVEKASTRKSAKYPAKISPSEMKAIVENKSTRVRNTTRIKRERLKIIPLGGIEEVGKNMTVFEYGNDIILVDCGVAFPEDEMLGVDLVTPDITYLERNRDRVRAIVITHGHEDHIGSIPYVLKTINVPIYATRLTLGLIQTKLEEHKMVRSTTMKCVRAGDIITLGSNFKVEFIQSTHSIADSVALAIHTPVGIVVHTGDFKIDYTPIDGKVMDFARLAELGKQGVLALMSDSTNSEREGYSMSESSVGKVFDKIFKGCDKRIIVATFASNVHRVQQIINSAIETNRKVSICGRSMLNVMGVAKELGYLDIPDGILIDIDEIDNYPPNRLVLITTGSQGETMAGLSRMAAGSHKKVTIGREDLVIISAHPIPGNEKLVSNVIDDLFKIGAEVIYHSLADVHVSGHACSEEQKLMLSLVKPKYFIPVHGEFRHLKAHAETAIKVGIPEENIVILSNGSALELDTNFCKITGTVPSGNVLIDGLGVGDVGNIVLRDRQHLSQDGVIIIVIAMDSKTGQIVAGPDIISRGFVYVRESEDLMDEIKRVAYKEIGKFEQNGIKDWTMIKNTLKDSLHDFLYVRTKRNPMLIPIITEV